MLDNLDYQKIGIIVILLIVVIALCWRGTEKFISGGTLNQLVSMDAQDSYLHGPEVYPYTTGKFLMTYGQPTKMYNINRGELNPGDWTTMPGSYLGSEFIAPQSPVFMPYYYGA